MWKILGIASGMVGLVGVIMSNNVFEIFVWGGYGLSLYLICASEHHWERWGQWGY